MTCKIHPDYTGAIPPPIHVNDITVKTCPGCWAFYIETSSSDAAGRYIAAREYERDMENLRLMDLAKMLRF